ncbi:MAG: MmgE/PrpD family protein [Alcaligenaceae bacterium]|nr:MmgE/PrpD family protein [Alcaligenaceae bacterium]
MLDTVARPQQSDTDFGSEYAAFAAALRVQDLPGAVLDAARENLFDTLSCAIAGSSAHGVDAVRDLVEEWAGRPEASILCSASRVPAHHAAWVNGMMSHARDYDDTHDAAVLHAGVSVVPAALAASQLAPKASGADLLAGIVAGLELICRLGVSTRVSIIESGFMYTSLFGYFAATAAAARVMGLDAAQTANALGIAYSQAAGTHQVTRDGAGTKRMQPGFAAKAALISVQMSQRGVQGVFRTFDGVDGLFRSYLHDRVDTERLRQGLGQSYDMQGLSYKPYPCCRFNHPAIEAALQIRQQPGFDPKRVRSAVVGMTHDAHQAVCTPEDIRRAPKTIVQAQFSIPYTVACALIDGEVAIRHFTEDGIRRPEVLALAARIKGVVNPEIEREWSRNISPAIVSVETEDGAFEHRIDYPKGHPKSHMTAADFDTKLVGCMAASGLAWPTDLPAQLHETIDGLIEAPDTRALINLLTP